MQPAPESAQTPVLPHAFAPESGQSVGQQTDPPPVTGTQWLLRHSALLVQPAPLFLEPGGVFVGAGVAEDVGVGVPSEGAHVPSVLPAETVHVVSPQQSASAVHGWPAPAQVDARHTNGGVPDGFGTQGALL